MPKTPAAWARQLNRRGVSGRVGRRILRQQRYRSEKQWKAGNESLHKGVDYRFSRPPVNVIIHVASRALDFPKMVQNEMAWSYLGMPSAIPCNMAMPPKKSR